MGSIATSLIPLKCYFSARSDDEVLCIALDLWPTEELPNSRLEYSSLGVGRQEMFIAGRCEVPLHVYEC